MIKAIALAVLCLIGFLAWTRGSHQQQRYLAIGLAALLVGYGVLIFVKELVR